MRRKVVVDEKLAAHEEEGSVMHAPKEHEESCRVP
jgi:hypothetical protein